MSEQAPESGVIYEPKPEFVVQIGDTMRPIMSSSGEVICDSQDVEWQFHMAFFEKDHAIEEAALQSIQRQRVRVVTREVAGL